MSEPARIRFIFDRHREGQGLPFEIVAPELLGGLLNSLLSQQDLGGLSFRIEGGAWIALRGSDELRRQVRAVFEQGPSATAAERFAEMARDLWREARARVEAGAFQRAIPRSPASPNAGRL